MDSKSPVAKSASNILNKSSRRNKKSVSNEDIKKRGVYVERKVVSTLLDAKEATNVQAKRKAPPRPRPGQKKFLSSVLTILSKSTASTQYPDINDTDAKKRNRLKPRRLKNDKIEANNKNKYKSKMLNENIRMGDEFIILQSKKDIAQTPSNYSESANVKWSDIEQTKDKSVYNEILEGKKFNDEMGTLAEMTKEDDNLYNLFVDLLETTFDVYNEKEYDLDDVTNTILEINEDVAKKLEFNSDTNKESIKTNKKVKIELDHPETVDIPLDINQSNPVTRPKIKSKSFSCPKKIQTLPKSDSYNKKKSAKSKKNNLLNILKEELKMDIPVEEPQNIYEALKVIAKNKQRTEKIIIEPKTKKNTYETGRDPECMFRRRNLLSRSRFRRRKREKMSENPFNEAPKTNKNKIKNIPSYKSVEVYGYNYVDEAPRELMQEGLVLTYHSSPTASDLDYYTLLQIPDSTGYFNFNL